MVNKHLGLQQYHILEVTLIYIIWVIYIIAQCLLYNIELVTL